ncbi:hypothetical protein BC833DRAFT_597964 [Globomyces pollinis-pini]|nr:hypothetical protein BC833DRAFT_597964 [Globomyces pollinis-pini]
MSIPLFDILLSLKNENLLGPTNHPKKLSDSLDPWRLISNEYTDLDSKDPRWFELFMEYFIDAKHEVTDDILFFVRQYVPSHKSSTGSINDLDPVLVKRRIAGQIPQLADVIDWKQSFFLNLISQLPCTLTVSICTRSLEIDKRKKWGSDSSEDIRQSTGDLSEPAKKNTMVAVKRVTKKVFAAPYKSRMDVKDAQMNECSYPLVYYTNNDFQEESLHLKIKPGEYLCAELSLTIPETKTSTEFINATEKVSQISLEDNSEPFPLPPNFSKITFFQGAVSFKALSDIYQQKGVAAANQRRNGWGNRSDEPFNSPRIEYVLMRGPHGKGQCQVAIQHPGSISLQSSSDGLLGFFKDVVKSHLGQDSTDSIPVPDLLECSMTYVNIPWQSIAADLLEYYEKLDSNKS